MATERNTLLAQLANTIALRGYETSISWGVFAVFGATNAVFLNIAIQVTSPPKNGELVAMAAGLVFSLFWLFIQKRVIAYINRYDALITRIEQRLGIDDDLAISLQINHRDRNAFVTGFSARSMMLVAVTVVIIAWVVLSAKTFLRV